MTLPARPNPFDYDDFRSYLREALAAERARRRGAQARLAEHVGCQSAYLSMVLAGKAMLSVEQAEGANEFFAHGEQEAHYFLLLVQRERAGTVRLRRYFERQIETLRAERTVLARRLSGTTTLAPEHQASYYGVWYHHAIHIALTVPALRTKEALTAYFGMPIEVVNRALEFLTSCGLAKREGEEYFVGPTRLHLEQASPLAQASHAQMRLRALGTLSVPRGEDFHYSSVISAAPADMPKLKEIMMRAIEEMRAVVRDSPEEGVFCYTMDLFPLRS